MFGGLGTGLGPSEPPWGVKNPWGMLPYDKYLVTGSRGPLNSNCKLTTTKTEHYFEFSENLKNTLS
jgi:hypothetical protein